ncbi:AraC family transcriptional regulator [Apibacter sp. HY039]|uniref:helix-turn-helix domain-containing protein n=1 Tax=Apibacter sp. HY039 TaxID=2501476 RepID=UPI000FEBF048|nr:AraC family transcriptional regulator [Apibacter sp. HY039]
MKKLFSLFCILILMQISNAEINKSSIDSIEQVIKETTKVDFSNTIKVEQAIENLKKIYLFSEKIHYDKGMLESGNYLMTFYYRKGQYEKLIHFATELETDMDLKKSTHFYLVSSFYRLLALSYRKLGFDEEGDKKYQNTFKSAQKIQDKEEAHLLLALIYKDQASYFSEIHKYPDSVGYYLFKSLKEIESIKDKEKLIRFANKIFIYNSIAVYYLKVAQPKDTVLAREYFMKSEKIYENTSPPMLAINEVEYLLTLSDFYLSEKNYDKAIELTEKALDIEKNNPTNAYKRKRMYEILTKSYLEKGDHEQSKKYMHLFTLTSDSIALEGANSIQKPLTKIIENNKIANQKQTQKILVFLAVILILVSIIVYIKVRNNQKKTHENYKKLIQKLKDNKDVLSQQIPENKNPEENTIIRTTAKISDETLNHLMAKLDKFEQYNGFLKKDLTLTSLAHSLNTNPKYLSEIIKENKFKSFNNYINGLRIKYITHKLYEEPVYRQYKIKYLSEECGYASHQVFILAFKKENGVTPSYYIERLKKEAVHPGETV